MSSYSHTIHRPPAQAGGVQRCLHWLLDFRKVWLNQFQILKANGFDPVAFDDAGREKLTQQILADNAVKFSYTPEDEVDAHVVETVVASMQSPSEEIGNAMHFRQVLIQQPSPSGNTLLNKYKYVLDAGVENTAEVVNERKMSNSASLDDKRVRDTASTLAGETPLKIEINPDWMFFKDSPLAKLRF